MFIFSGYVKSFNFKNNLVFNKDRFINYNYNFKNNIIHFTLFMISINLYLYFFTPIIYKNSFKNFLNFNFYLVFLLSDKSLNKTHI